MEDRIEEVTSFFERKIRGVVDDLFIVLEKSSINVNLEREQLNEKEYKKYLEIYSKYKRELNAIRKDAIEKFGDSKYLNLIFSTTIEKLVKEKEL